MNYGFTSTESVWIQLGNPDNGYTAQRAVLGASTVRRSRGIADRRAAGL